MKLILRGIVIALSMGMILLSHAQEWELVWKIDGLATPESIAHDPIRNKLFVSLQHHGLNGSENRTIAMLDTKGNIINEQWVTGLNAPKGIAIKGDKLFVSDIKDLVEIDIPSAKIVARYSNGHAQFLNDVAIDDEGVVYVSDMFTSAIHRLTPDGDFSEWLKSADLENPNGLLVQGNNLLIAAWGTFSDGKPLAAPAGHVLKLALDTQEISSISYDVVGNLDGLQRESSQSLLVSDWMKGGIIRVTNGKAEQVISTEPSAADILYLDKRQLLLVPMAKQGELLGYQKR